jgi:aspartate beta-hydroxylase
MQTPPTPIPPPTASQAVLADVERRLAANPRDALALIQRADLFVAAGDTRAASAFYAQALRVAPPPQQRALAVTTALQRAQAALQRHAQEYKGFLLERLAEDGFVPGEGNARFGEALALLLGEKRIYTQQPKYFYFPGLPQVQFFDRETLPWLDPVEAATADIRQEVLGLLDEPGALRPYVQSDPRLPRKTQEGMLDNPAWSAHYLYENGTEVPGARERFPRTFAALRDVPLCQLPQRSPSVLFSVLRPGAHIPPHNGLINTRMICHLPLIVPPGCGFRVGNEVREWREGVAWAFDDTIEHEAWNRSDQTRVILLFEAWKPEVTAAERALLARLFAAIDAHSGVAPTWEI